MRKYKPFLTRLRDAAKRRPELYHTTRVLLDVKPDVNESTGGRGSGVDPHVGWEQFLGEGAEVFAAREYVRGGRWQQSCFFGEADRLKEYSSLASQAWQALPTSFAAPLDLSGRLETDRDVWTLALYRFALEDRTLFKLDMHGTRPYGDLVVRGLEKVVVRTCPGVGGEGVVIEDFREVFQSDTGRRPEFVFATLRVDVFTATCHAVDVLLERGSDLHPWPGDVCAVAAIARMCGCPPEKPTGHGPLGQNEERDAYLYRQRCNGATLAELRLETRTRSEWYRLGTPQAVAQAVNRYADRHGLDRPASRKRQS